MIVRENGERLLLITQPAHAQAAGAIMERAVALADNPRRGDILYAVGEHDNGWAAADAHPEVDPETGRILDFVSAPLRVRHGVWPRGVAALANRPWAAALVAQHAITVYDRFRPSAEWASFFAGMEDMRAQMLQRSAGDLSDLLDDYVFVRLGDLISLTFCIGWTDEHRFGGWSVRRAGDRIVVTPDPFGGAMVPFDVSAAIVPNQRFDSDAALHEAIASAPTITLSGEVRGARGD